MHGREGYGQKAGESHYVGLETLGGFKEVLGRHVLAQIFHREPEGLEGKRSHVLPDVVYVVGDGAQQHQTRSVAPHLVLQARLGELHDAPEDLTGHYQPGEIDVALFVSLANRS